MILRRIGVDTLLTAGVCGGVSMLWTAGDAYQRNHKVHVLEDCVAGASPQGHDAALTLTRRSPMPAGCRGAAQPTGRRTAEGCRSGRTGRSRKPRHA